MSTCKKKKEGKRLTTQNVVVNDIYGWQHYRNRVTIIVNKAEDSVYALMLEKTKPCHNTSKAKKRFEQRGWLSIHSELITRKKRMKKSTYITNRKRRTDSEKQREKAPLDGTQKKRQKTKRLCAVDRIPKTFVYIVVDVSKNRSLCAHNFFRQQYNFCSSSYKF